MANYTREIDYSFNKKLEIAEKIYQFKKPVKYLSLTYQGTERIKDFKKILGNQLEKLSYTQNFEYYIAEEKNKKPGQLHVHLYLKFKTPTLFNENHKEFYVQNQDTIIKFYMVKLHNPIGFLLYLHKEDENPIHNLNIEFLHLTFYKIYYSYEKKVNRKVDTNFVWEGGFLIAEEKELENELKPQQQQQQGKDKGQGQQEEQEQQEQQEQQEPPQQEQQEQKQDYSLMNREENYIQIIFSNSFEAEKVFDFIGDIGDNKIIYGVNWKDFTKTKDLNTFIVLIDNTYNFIEYNEIKLLLRLEKLQQMNKKNIYSNMIFKNILEAKKIIVCLPSVALSGFDELNEGNFYDHNLTKIQPLNINNNNIERIEQVTINNYAPEIDLIGFLKKQEILMDDFLVSVKALQKTEMKPIQEEMKEISKSFLLLKDEFIKIKQESKELIESKQFTESKELIEPKQFTEPNTNNSLSLEPLKSSENLLDINKTKSLDLSYIYNIDFSQINILEIDLDKLIDYQKRIGEEINLIIKRKARIEDQAERSVIYKGSDGYKDIDSDNDSDNNSD